MDADNGKILRLDNPKIAAETAFSPGSLVKVFAALYGLKTNIIDPSLIIHCSGAFDINGKQLPCWDHTGHGAVDLYKALAYSCNVYFYHQAVLFDNAGFSEFPRFFRTMGFGQKTGIDLPNETAGSVPDIYDPLEKIKAAAGATREILVTPIQVITAFAAVVNGGRVLTPFQSQGHTIVNETLALDAQLPIIHRALQEASTYGTSAGFYQETGGFAKTGTAPQADLIHSDAWFVGYLPLQNRKIVILALKTNGTGAKDALPIGLEIARELKNKALDQELVSVSLFSLLKPRTGTITGRFGLLEINDEDDREGEQGEPLFCRKLEVKLNPGGSLTVWADNVETGIHHRVAIRPQQPGGFSSIQLDNVENRDYPGQITIRSNGDFLDIINRLPLKDYLIGVIGCEMGMLANSDSHFEEALKCQAILSRTYALKNLKRHNQFDFCDTTHCQHYAGIPRTPLQPETNDLAVRQTGGIVLTYNGQLCDVYYHSTCGGFTCDAEGVWQDNNIPYLRSIDDHGRCSVSPHFRWNFQVEETRFFEILKAINGETPVDLRIKKTDSAGWVKQIAIVYPGGREKILRGEELHICIGRSLGWNTIKSANFALSKSGNTRIFSGKGLGHGVGLCQYGARSMAHDGKDYKEILAVYFPGAVVDAYWVLINALTRTAEADGND
ncbi:MAG: stage sporulation protein [Acidobacteriota bacterium]|nr:stage sporulation protein [Acidobacteriota bacterium]